MAIGLRVRGRHIHHLALYPGKSFCLSACLHALNVVLGAKTVTDSAGEICLNLHHFRNEEEEENLEAIILPIVGFANLEQVVLAMHTLGYTRFD